MKGNGDPDDPSDKTVERSREANEKTNNFGIEATIDLSRTREDNGKTGSAAGG